MFGSSESILNGNQQDQGQIQDRFSPRCCTGVQGAGYLTRVKEVAFFLDTQGAAAPKASPGSATEQDPPKSPTESILVSGQLPKKNL